MNILFANYYVTVYVDSSSACNELAFQLGTTAIGATIPTRTWTIKA